MKISTLLMDWLIWVSLPVTGVCWLHILYPVWRQFPPYALILLALVLIGGLAFVTSLFIPIDAPWHTWVYRGFQVGSGLVLALWRLAP
ncbi:MAG TPA: hypothetical protein V6D12_10870 [Candidatus Obscuribacterales bacterium]